MKRGAPEDVVAQQESARRQMGPGRSVLIGLVLVGVQAVVKEHVDDRMLLEDLRKDLPAVAELEAMSCTETGRNDPAGRETRRQAGFRHALRRSPDDLDGRQIDGDELPLAGVAERLKDDGAG